MLTKEQIDNINAELGVTPTGAATNSARTDFFNSLSTVADVGYKAGSPNQTGNPLTSPTMPFSRDDNAAKVAGKAVVNFPTSAVRTGAEALKLVANILNPDFIVQTVTKGRIEDSNNTLVNLAKLGSGLLQKITGTKTEDTDIADAVGNALVDRYGSIENIKRTIAEDPAGVLLDISTLIEGGGAVSARVSRLSPVRQATELGARTMKGTGESLFKSAITPNMAEAERILSYKAKTPFLKRTLNYLTGKESPNKPVLRSDTALAKGEAGTQKMIGVQASREAQKLWTQKIAPAVKNSPVRVSKEDLFAPIRERIADTIEPGRRQALQDAFDAVVDEYKTVDSWTLEEAQKLKRQLDERTPEKLFRGQNIANDYKIIKNDMANAIRQRTYQALDNKQDYLDYGNLAELEELGVKAISEAGTKGGFGGFWTTMWDMATTPVKTVGGQTLYRVGNAFEFAAESGITTFGAFLASRGLEKPDQDLTTPTK